MFETLTERLGASFSFFKNKKELTEANVDEGLAAVRQALLEADVNFKLARDFTDRVKARALGEQRLAGVEASDQFVHAVHAELVELMGPEDATLEVAKSGPTVILMAGLQGAGKTTTCAKLAKHLRDKHGKRPWVTLGCTVENQEGKAVAKGEAQVAAPTEKETVTVVPPPAIQLLEEAALASD